MSTESGMVLEALLSANEMCRSAAEIARRGGADTNWPLFLKRLTESCVLQARVIHGHEVREDSATCTAKTFKNPRYELAAAPAILEERVKRAHAAGYVEGARETAGKFTRQCNEIEITCQHCNKAFAHAPAKSVECPFCERVLYLISAAPASPPTPAVDGWQPIETAPKDGTVVCLLICNTSFCGYWKTWGEYEDAQDYSAAWVGLIPVLWGSHAQRTAQPTHWKPLPESPK